MATTPTTPSTPAAAPVTPAAATPTPSVTPATPAAATPIPAAAAPATPATPATPAAAEPAVPTGDFSDLLADDLKPIAAEPAVPAAPAPGADLATKYKDDPQVQQLITEHAAAKPIAETIKANRYAIANPEELKLQLEDSNALYDIMYGKKKASDLVQIMLSNPAWDKATKDAVIADLRDYIGRVTGQPIAAAAAGQPIQDPAMAEIEKIKAERQAEKDSQAQAALVTRVNTARATLTTKVNELLTGTWLEGEGEYIMARLGEKFGGAEKAMEVVSMVERGEFSQITKALQQIKNEEAVRLKARTDRLIEMKKKKAATIPAQVAGGTPAAPAQEPTNVVELDPDKRRKQMLDNWRSGA